MLSLMFTHVSQLAYLHSFNQYYNASKDSDFSKELVVVDRATGAPMAAVEATFYENNYNQSRQRNEWIEKSKASSDRDGKIIPSLSANKSFTVKLQKNKDYKRFICCTGEWSEWYHDPGLGPQLCIGQLSGRRI